MKIGLWNIDHPEVGSGAPQKENRYRAVTEYLIRAHCDLYLLTEANAALELPGYYRAFSAESPFQNSSRFYGSPNRYHQAAIYSASPLERIVVPEPVNGVLCKLPTNNGFLFVYANVITIKDQWDKSSTQKFAQRLEEQLQIIAGLPPEGTLIGGDFNLRLGWPQKHAAYQRVQELAAKQGWIWPTESREDTVQHVMHTKNLKSGISLDHSAKEDHLSDHPFVTIELVDP